VNKTVTIDLIHATPASVTADARAATGAAPLPIVHPQSLLDLPPGEARQSLLAVHGILDMELPPAALSIYEAGGGSTSFLPLDVLRRAHVTVVDIDEDQIRNNDYAQQTILGDVQTYRFPPGSFDLVICYNVIEHLADVEAALLGFCESLKQGGLILIGNRFPVSSPDTRRTGSMSGSTGMCAARKRPANRARRRSRRISIRWSRFRSSRTSPIPTVFR